MTTTATVAQALAFVTAITGASGPPRPAVEPVADVRQHQSIDLGDGFELRVADGGWQAIDTRTGAVSTVMFAALSVVLDAMGGAAACVDDIAGAVRQGKPHLQYRALRRMRGYLDGFATACERAIDELGELRVTDGPIATDTLRARVRLMLAHMAVSLRTQIPRLDAATDELSRNIKTAALEWAVVLHAENIEALAAL